MRAHHSWFCRSCLAFVFAAGGLPAKADDLLDNGALATILGTQAKGLVSHSQKATESTDRNQRLRNNRGSNFEEAPKEAECGGVAIGNVRPVLGDHRQHNTTVIIRGNVLNVNNRC